jgi:hypothetical protein
MFLTKMSEVMNQEEELLKDLLNGGYLNKPDASMDLFYFSIERNSKTKPVTQYFKAGQHGGTVHVVAEIKKREFDKR